MIRWRWSIKPGDDDALKQVLDKYGPVAVAFDASHSNFVSYSDDNYGSTNNSCSKNKIDHSVMLRGYFGMWKIRFKFIYNHILIIIVLILINIK
jgi:hypothetical protein